MELAEDSVDSLKGVIEWLDKHGGGKKEEDGEQHLCVDLILFRRRFAV